MSNNPMEFATEHPKIMAGSALVAAGAIIGGAALMASGEGSGPEQQVIVADSTTTLEASAELRNRLTIDMTDPSLSCVEVVKNAGGEVVGSDIVHKIDAVTTGVEFGNPLKRQWSDAIDTPYLSDQANKEALLLETQKEICENPLFGAMVANGFANLEVGDVKVVDLNEWLQPAAGGAEGINDLATSFVEDEQELEYTEFAAYLNTMLTRFNNEGAQTPAGVTVLNYNLAGEGLQVATMPEVQLNSDQYEANAFVLAVTDKINGCVKRIGFNLGDKRYLELECVALPPEETPDTPDQPGGPTTTTTGKPGTTTTTEWVPPKTARPPVEGGPSTTVEAPVPGTDVPTTSTTAPPVTQPTTQGTTSTTAPQGGFDFKG